MSRFTPAYAGNTLPSAGFSLRAGVHPRIRGEYWRNVKAENREQGSPPHTRGIPGRLVSGTENGRFTPAYAGNTRRSYHRLPRCRVHPRIRGEYGYYPVVTHYCLGSPPHTRGIRVIRAPAVLIVSRVPRGRVD